MGITQVVILIHQYQRGVGMNIQTAQSISSGMFAATIKTTDEFVSADEVDAKIKEYRSECSRLSHEVGFEKRRANNKDAHIKELTEMLRKVNKYYGIPPHSDKAYEIQHEIQALLKGESK